MGGGPSESNLFVAACEDGDAAEHLTVASHRVDSLHTLAISHSTVLGIRLVVIIRFDICERNRTVGSKRLEVVHLPLTECALRVVQQVEPGFRPLKRMQRGCGPREMRRQRGTSGRGTSAGVDCVSGTEEDERRAGEHEEHRQHGSNVSARFRPTQLCGHTRDDSLSTDADATAIPTSVPR